MAIDDNTVYGLKGSQIKDLPSKINAVKGLAKVLSSADYNANKDNWSDTDPTHFNCVALWKLEPGLYNIPNGVVAYATNSRSASSFNMHIVGRPSSVGGAMKILSWSADDLSSQLRTWFVTDSSTGAGTSYIQYLNENSIIDNLTSTSNTRPLSAKQGKVLKDLIDAITGFSYEVVQTLPASGQNGKIYLVPIDESGGPSTNYYDEYIWVNNAWEQIGTTEMDLTNYVQFSDLATVATTGDYDDLNDKPTIPSVVQTTGTSTADVMSQNATTGMVFRDPATKRQVQIGDGATASGTSSVAVGPNAPAGTDAPKATGTGAVAIGAYGTASNDYSIAIAGTASANGAIAIGWGSQATSKGQFDISTRNTSYGYNNSLYRLLSGVYDPQSAHDAATKGYVDGTVRKNAGTPTTSVSGQVGQLLEDTTNGELYQCTAASGSTYTWTKIAKSSEVPAAQVNSDWDAVSGVAQILNKPSLATVATSGSYSDLSNKPTIPTVNNATLTIQKNGVSVETFTANSSTNKTANITTPDITMTDTDPGEGSALAPNNFVAVYGESGLIDTADIATGAVTASKIDFTSFNSTSVGGVASTVIHNAGDASELRLFRVGNLVIANGTFILNSLGTYDQFSISNTVPLGFRPSLSIVDNANKIYLPFTGSTSNVNGGWSVSHDGEMWFSISTAFSGSVRFFYNATYLTDDDYPSQS